MAKLSSSNQNFQPAQNGEINSQRAFWASVIFTLVALISFVFSLFLTSRTPIWQVYTIMAITTAALAMDIIGLASVWRGRTALGLKYFYWSLMFTVPPNAFLVTNTTWYLIAIVLLIGFTHVFYLQPRTWQKYYQFGPIVAAIIMAVVEMLQPAFRANLTNVIAASGYFGQFILLFLVLSLIFLIVRQAWSGNIRTKFLVSIIGISVAAVAIFGVFVLLRNQQSQTFWSSELQTAVQLQSQQQINSSVRFEAYNADQVLSKITESVQQLADLHATLFTSQNIFGEGGYWDGNSQLILLPDGQYGNAASDPASIFIPNLVSLSPALIADLNTSAYLDFSAPAILKENPNIVALYYISTSNYTVYYPNIDLAHNVPPDFNTTDQPFYTIATPENNPEREAKWTVPYQDPAGTGLIVTNAVPVYDRNDRFRGVMAADIQLSKISEQISTAKLGESGFAFLIDPSGHIIAMPDAGYKLFGIEPEVVPVNESPKTTLLGFGSADFQNITQNMVMGGNGLATATLQDTQYYIAYAPLPTIGYSIGLITPRAELDAAYLVALEKVQNETRVNLNLFIVTLLVVIAAAIGVGIFLSQFVSSPLVQLTKVAEEISHGNLDAKAEIRTTDEIGKLAETFNDMTSQLRGTLSTLEQRVAARTRNLQLAAEVGQAVSQVRTLNVMLKEACELILKEFSLYYVQVYLTDTIGSSLILEAGTGYVGDQLVERRHSLTLNTASINGRAAVEKRPVVISDTSISATFQPNKLLPETRGEIAVPLVVSDKVVGVLDMQSSYPGVLTEEILPAFEALAGQLAVAVQNANLLAETEQARAQVEAQARRLVREGWNEHLDAIHEPEQFGFVFEQNNIVPLENDDGVRAPDDGNAVVAPIAVTGEPVGSLVVEIEDETRREQTRELINVVANQVAQQIENLRLLESAERFRAEAEEASRRLTREGWKTYTEKADQSLGYFYNLNEVLPLNGAPHETTGTTLPLKVRNEVVGKLAVQSLDSNDAESLDLVNAVAERLAAHIESLRQFDETRRSQVELDKRARQLAAVAEISTVSSKELDIQKMLESVVYLTQRQFGLYHAHVFLFNEDSELLKIAACGWKEGDEHEGSHGTAAIPLNQEQSLVARAARTKQSVIVNDVHNEPGWLPNPLLPDTASELAVPLFVGDELLGVLDVQSDRLDAFTEEDANIQTTLASQVATALQNARSFDRARKQAERESMLNVINQKIQSATSVEAVLQIAARELGHALGAPMTVAQLSMKDNGSS